MMLPDGRSLAVFDNVLLEPNTPKERIVLWVQTERTNDFESWSGVVSVAGAQVHVARGICYLPVSLTPVRRGLGHRFAAIVTSPVRRPQEQDYVLPDGRLAHRYGSRRTDVALAWPQDSQATCDEAAIRRKWPLCREVRQIGERLYLADGIVEASPSEPVPMASTSYVPSTGNVRDAAEQALAIARGAGDRGRELTAWTDLGLVYLQEGNGAQADSLLCRALEGARALQDRQREADILNSLALSALIQNRPSAARELLGSVVAYAQAAGDRHVEKLAWERLGLANLALRDHYQALTSLERALALSLSVGDVTHQAALLWQLGIQHAELGRRMRAIARAQEAVALLRRHDKPQARWFARHVKRYRLGNVAPASVAGSLPATPNSPATGLLGGTIDTSDVVSQPPAQTVAKAATGPDILTMALTATKAMREFVGSGFKTTTAEAYSARLSICSNCEHDTGLRCRVCGCLTAAKARMLHEDCPANKWPKGAP